MSLRELRSDVGELLRGHEKITLCLDFDGTLAPIVPGPDAATLPESTRRHLIALARSPDVDIVVISGRALEDVRARGASSDEASFVIAAVQSVVDDDDLKMVVDEQSIEIRPDIDHHKGHAVEALSDDDSLVIYFGDARTDVDAFRTLAGWEDETVHVSVGSELPASGHLLESPDDVGQFLQWVRTELGDLEA